MKIGLLLTSHPDPETSPYPHQSVHARVTDEVLTAEEHGFDSVWIAEHHFSNQYGILPDPFSYLCYLAAKTSRIKLGAAVMVVPLHHPLRIVENAAFVDILSDGRFQLGLGSGYRPYEFEGLGVAYEERRVMMQEEAVPLILQGFFDKRVNADGKYFKIRMDEQAEVFPQPIQQPHPPIYMAAGTAGSMAYAARNGFGLMQSTLPSIETIGEHVALYRKHMAEAKPPYTQNPAFGDIDVARMVYVAESDARAREESEEAVVRHMKGFIGGGTGSYLGDVAEKSDERAFAYEELVKDTVLHGSPDTVLRGLEALASAGASSMMIHYPPYYGPSKTVKMLELFAREVLPQASAFEPGGAGAAARQSD